MEIPVNWNGGSIATSVYVQRVGDFVCFYEGFVSDTDVARRSTVAQYRISAKALARIVARLERGVGTSHKGYGYRAVGETVVWSAPCGNERNVSLDVLAAVVAEFGSDL